MKDPIPLRSLSFLRLLSIISVNVAAHYRDISIRVMCLWIAGAAINITTADDNLLAHQLFSKGDYAQAAEIFTDPAWKGLALYRSAQWWRAAEAFIRAGDATSIYNLGNCYVKLGYYELALDAYQQALSIDPTLVAATTNADIMRQLLALQNEDEERSGRQLSDQAIDRLETERDAEDPAAGEDGDQQNEQSDPDTVADSGNRDQAPTPGSSQSSARAGDSDQAEQSAQRQSDNLDESAGAIRSNQASDEVSSQLSGSSESSLLTEDSRAAGLRTALQAEQATRQWLNSIQHDPQRYLARRITLETQRRQASGQAAPAGGSAW